MRITRISLNTNFQSWSPEIWNLIFKSMKAQGFNIHSVQDAKDMVQRIVTRMDGVENFIGNTEAFPEWNNAIEKAFQSKKNRVNNLQQSKQEKDKYPDVNWNRLRELGTTNQMSEAGFITPNGSLIDLSAKREGGIPGKRALDHREAGGNMGMYQVMAYGYIRIDYRSGSIHMAKQPTNQQYQAISQFFRSTPSDQLTVDMQDGLGEVQQGYYRDPPLKFSYTYTHSTPLSTIINDIMNYWKNPSNYKK